MLPKAVKKFKKIFSYTSYRDFETNHKYQAISYLLISLAVTSTILAVRHLGMLQTVELAIYDLLVKLTSQDPQDPELLLVEITETDIKNQNRWPLSDQTLAQLLEKIQQHQPAAIGLDIYRDLTYPPGTAALSQQLQQPNVISIQYLGDGENQVAPPQGVSPQQVGFNDLVLDRDDVLRRNLMFARLGTTDLYSFSLKLSLLYLQHNFPEQDFTLQVDNNNFYLGQTVIPRLSANSGGYQMTASEASGWQTLINYQSFEMGQRITLSDVLTGKFDPSLVKDKVVVIGTTATSIKDFFATPYSGKYGEMAGAIAHAKMTKQIIGLATGASTSIWFVPETWEWLWIGLWSSAVAGIFTKAKSKSQILILGSAAILLVGGSCYLLFSFGGWVPFFPVALGIGATALSIACHSLWHDSRYDTLTALPNQTLLKTQLTSLQKQYLKTASTGSIMIQCLDLNRFKMINDALGYQAGDALLIETARRLQATLDRETLVARVGSDEFAIAKVIKDETTALAILEQIRQALSQPVDLAGLHTSTQIAVGYILKSNADDLEPETLLRSARTAMYQAKASGKVSHQMFASVMREQALKRLQLEADLHQAIENHEFELYYQPIINLNTEMIAGFEALIRWISPSRGFVSPGAFIPVAEETGTIIVIGEWVLQQACKQMVRWQQKFPFLKDCFMSVNLSIKQFSQPNLVSTIQKIVQENKLNFSSLKLEITESMVMENVDEAIAILDTLKALNIKLSIDDFGTGFSSFSYLHRFPLDTLKIDRSFVSNMSKSQKNLDIVTTIVLLAHKLGMDIVAEGIEQEVEKKTLQALNCEYAQGYFFAKPLPVEQINNLLLKNNESFQA